MLLQPARKHIQTTFLCSASIFLVASCGFLAQKKGNTPKQKTSDAPVLSTPPIVPQVPAPVQQNDDQQPQQAVTPAPSTGTEVTANGGGSVVTGDSGFEKVVDGGTESGLIEDGTVYFAPGETVFFNFKYEISNGETKVSSTIYFKAQAPDGALLSHLHAGSCSDETSKHYQHIVGNSTPEVSELKVNLEGTGLVKKGVGKGKFVPRAEELSYVIQYNGGLLCAPFGKVEPVATVATPSPEPLSTASPSAPPNTVEEGGNKTGLLANGKPYFAGNDTLFYQFSFRSTGGTSTISSDIYFKEVAPTADLASYLHEGKCSNSSSPRYQHIAGDATPGTSEFHINLSGLELSKTGKTTVQYVPRSGELSYVIQFGDTRLCSDLLIKTVSTTPTPIISEPPGTVVAGGNVSGLLPDGTPYFATGTSFFFNVKYQTTNNVTKVSGEIYFKNANPTDILNSYIHSDTCENKNSARYQHIEGNSAPEASEIHIPLSGTSTIKKGVGVGQFAFRKEPLSYVIINNGERICANIKQPQ